MGTMTVGRAVLAVIGAWVLVTAQLTAALRPGHDGLVFGMAVLAGLCLVLSIPIRKRTTTVTMAGGGLALGDDITITGPGGARARYRVVKMQGATITVRPR